MKNKLFQAKLDHRLQLEQLEKTYNDSNATLQRKIDDQDKIIIELNIQVEALRKESSIFSHIDQIQMKRPNKDNSTQTEVEDDGFWDRQDGWILPISRSVVARSRWRQAINFALCPSCRGVGKYIAKVAAELKKARLGVADMAGIEAGTVMQNNSVIRKWVVPDELVLFLSNLPRSVQAINPYTLPWTVKRTHLLLNLKLHSDREDFAMGFRPQSMLDFAIELFLHNAESRAKAEINLYVFIKSLKEHYEESPMLKMLARFMGVTDSLTKAQRAKLQQENAKFEKVVGGGKRRTTVNKATSSNPYYEHDFVADECALSKDIVGACLFARECMLFGSYSGLYASQIAAVKEKVTTLQDFQRSLQKTAAKLFSRTNTGISEAHSIQLPDHVVVAVTEGCSLYIPLDRAIRVLNPFITGLSHQESLSIFHFVEDHCKVLHADGSIYMPEGLRSFIRSVLRLFASSENATAQDIDNWDEMIDNYVPPQTSKKISRRATHAGHSKTATAETEGGKDEEEEEGNNNDSSNRGKKLARGEDEEKEIEEGAVGGRYSLPAEALQYTLVVNIDIMMMIVAEVCRRKLTQIERRLKNIFEEGDINHDNVLSFEEFRDIVLKVDEKCPDRKILRMFREALSQGKCHLST